MTPVSLYRRILAARFDLLKGRDHKGRSIERRIAIVTDYDGPATPSSAAILLARKILTSGPPRTGAFPCVGLLALDEILDHLRPLGIWCVRGDESGWTTQVRDINSDLTAE